MKREEKNALSRQRILQAALKEFSDKGYNAASLNTICAENDISKGIIYHYFRDKDELYLLCAAECFEQLTAYLETAAAGAGTAEQRLSAYFEARLRFFSENPVYLGIFLQTTLMPPAQLSAALAGVKSPFDALNICTLTALLENAALRSGLTAAAVVEDFRVYMDFFNARFCAESAQTGSPELALQKHEERCHRQIDILLHGVLAKENE